SGIVTAQASARPIPGAAVIVKGTKHATATDDQGRFTITAEPGQMIRVTSLGFAPKELKAGASTTLNISLEDDYRLLNETVVVGYGRMKKTDQSSAQVSISAAEINRTVNTTIDQAIQGRAAG